MERSGAELLITTFECEHNKGKPQKRTETAISANKPQYYTHNTLYLHASNYKQKYIPVFIAKNQPVTTKGTTQASLLRAGVCVTKKQ